jgi:hypothetical protein
MAEPIGPLPQPVPSQPMLPKAVPNVPVLSKQMQDQVLTLADHFQKVLDDPTLAMQRSFLNEFANNASDLNRTVDQALLVR